MWMRTRNASDTTATHGATPSETRTITVFETRFPATGMRPQRNVIATSVPASGSRDAEDRQDREQEERRQDRVHGRDLDLGLRDRAEALAEAAEPLLELRPERPRRIGRGAEEDEDADDGPEERVHEAARADGPRVPQLARVLAQPVRDGLGRAAAGRERQRDAGPLERLLQARERVPHPLEDGRKVADTASDEAVEEDDRERDEPRRDEAEEARREGAREAVRDAPAAQAARHRLEERPREESREERRDEMEGAAPRGARARRGRTMPARTERIVEPPARRSSCGIIRPAPELAGQPVALRDEGVALGAQARDRAGRERERKELSRLPLTPRGVFEEEKRRYSCEWKRDESESAPGGAADAPRQRQSRPRA